MKGIAGALSGALVFGVAMAGGLTPTRAHDVYDEDTFQPPVISRSVVIERQIEVAPPPQVIERRVIIERRVVHYRPTVRQVVVRRPPIVVVRPRSVIVEQPRPIVIVERPDREVFVQRRLIDREELVGPRRPRRYDDVEAYGPHFDPDD